MTDLVLFLHISGALLFASGIVLAGAGFEGARRQARPEEIALLLGLSRLGVLLVMPGALLLLGCGLWLVHLEHFGFDAGWIQAALGLFIIALLLGAIGGRRPKRARKLAADLAQRGEVASAELRALLDDPASRAVNYASGSLVVAILALMVFKP